MTWLRSGLMARTNAAAAAAALLFAAGSAFAAGGGGHVEDVSFSFEGPFGKYDQEQLQRGLLVYQEVCAACHGLQFVPFRTLGDADGVGLSEAAVKAFAAQFDVYDSEIDDYRPARPVDNFPANDSVGAPDLSLMAKARVAFSGPYGTGLSQLLRSGGGSEYIAGLMVGYTGKEREEAGTLLYENTAFPGGWISMAPPLPDEIVEYADGSDNSSHALSMDVSAFLMWAAEPKMMARKQMGFVAALLLGLLTVLLYLTNKAIWAPVKKRGAE